MPIRFYCPFCDTLLGISRRKAGAVVLCPSCHGAVGVPSEEAGFSQAPAASPGWLLPAPPRGPVSSSDIVLTPAQLLAILLALMLMLCLSFAAGLLLGALS
jgi:hypothetical protein